MYTSNIKPIETEYRGYKFRSRTEARWAVLFDNLGIEWVYEPEGIMTDGIYYLPDFYLPKAKQFFECKGIMQSTDMHKITSLVGAGYPVTVGFSNMTFWCSTYLFDGTYEFEPSESILAECKRCGGKWFFDYNGFWGCPCCGEYDGNRHVDWLIQGGEREVCEEEVDDWVWEAFSRAKSARFEHGEKPIFRRYMRHGSRENF